MFAIFANELGHQLVATFPFWRPPNTRMADQHSRIDESLLPLRMGQLTEAHEHFRYFLFEVYGGQKE